MAVQLQVPQVLIGNVLWRGRGYNETDIPEETAGSREGAEIFECYGMLNDLKDNFVG